MPPYSSDRPASDLTSRARIRDAALVQFAERGFSGTSLRSIAEAAEVSLGAVQHHFASKEALREACDALVVEAFGHRLTRSAADGTLGDAGFMAELYDTSGPMLRYLARALIDGSPAAATVFDQLAAGAQTFLSHTWPDRFPTDSPATRDAAAVMAAMHSGTIVLHGHIERHFGSDPLDRAHATRTGNAMLALYSAMGEFAASSTAEQIRKSAAEYDSPKES
ncbi:TetR family transcriptional regulator [Stackebrandtia endophytica]|uniref:TetR family transcriptional regulator n=1 Tax=Stackebrandtia endophytica TaxID=1496996 RepID=A0A543AR15_9ACTN|nr:TetR family transcriptional regulator [Stackebrandtia endophytica]TQL75033.1 TetR family transcriptional regulator [Stackebrandtia endophytica]